MRLRPLHGVGVLPVKEHKIALTVISSAKAVSIAMLMISDEHPEMFSMYFICRDVNMRACTCG